MSWVRLKPFVPHPWLRGGHAQTIAGAFWPNPTFDHPCESRRVPLADGDVVVVQDECPVGWSREREAVLLVHGLGGNHQSGHVRRLSGYLYRLGWRTFRMDMRGTGAGLYEARRFTHAGRSEDVGAVVEAIGAWTSWAPLTLIGFSMGGNQVLKLLAEYQSVPPAWIKKAVAVAPPICLHRCSRAMKTGLNRLYDHNFIQTLRQQVRLRRHVPGFCGPDHKKLPDTLQGWDRQVTAPLGGFSGLEDYYDQASTRHRLGEIHVPTLILADRHDPVVPFSSFQELDASPRVQVEVTENGGHLGYVAGRSSDPDARWLDWRLLEQVVESTAESIHHQAIRDQG